MARIFIARHAETTWNLAGRYQGRRESALSALGICQGLALAGALAVSEPRIERIIASPLVRCMATATFVAERMNLAVETDDRLVEIAHGTWQGRLRDEIAINDAERLRTWKERPTAVNFEGGETLADVAARWQAFARTLDTSRATLVVTHDVIARLAILDAQHRSHDDLWKAAVENAGFATYDVADNTWTLIAESVNAHLTDIHASPETQAL